MKLGVKLCVKLLVKLRVNFCEKLCGGIVCEIFGIEKNSSSRILSVVVVPQSYSPAEPGRV